MRTTTKILSGVAHGFMLSCALLFNPAPALSQAISNPPFVPDLAFCNTVGAIAMRGTSKWGCASQGISGQLLKSNGAGALPTWTTVAGAGTVTSVGLALPSIFTVTNSPVIVSGTLTGTLNSQAANLVFAGPTSSTAAPTFRSLVVGDLPSMATSTMLANISGSTGTPTAATITSVLDYLGSSTQGSLLYRGPSAWIALAPGTSGQFLQTQGAGSNVVWSGVSGANGGTVTTITAGTGITLSSGATCTTTCTVSQPSIAAGHVIGNGTGSTATATDSTLSSVLDQAISSTQGTIMYRSASGWTNLAPGTSGQVLQTGGAAANPSWASASAPSWTLLSTWTPTATPTQDFTGLNLNNYEQVMIELVWDGTNLVTFASTSLAQFRLSKDNCATFEGARNFGQSTSSTVASGFVKFDGNKTSMVNHTSYTAGSNSTQTQTEAYTGFSVGFSGFNCVRIQSTNASVNFVASQGFIKLYAK
jgi:hypothetical protein